MRKLPPFADRDLDERMVGILRQMDYFHGDSALALIVSALSGINDGDVEPRYYLLSYRAEVLYYEGLFNEAMRDLNEAERLAFDLKDSTLVANVYNLKGLIHENIQEGREAIPFLKEALRWFPRDPAARYPVTELHHIHGNLGTYLMGIPGADSAEFHIRRSLSLAAASGAERAKAVAWWSLGELDLQRARADSSLTAFGRSWMIADRTRDRDVALDALMGQCRALHALGRIHMVGEAMERAESYLAEHSDVIGAATRRNFARKASALYENMGDVTSALRWVHQWRALDSAISARNTRQALATQAELIRADIDLGQERSERMRMEDVLRQERFKRKVWIGGGVLVLITISAIFRANAVRQKHKRQLAESEALRAQQARTIEELRVREQIGRDLHDDLGVGLAGLKLRSEMALRSEDDPDRRHHLGALAGTAGELIGNMRQIIWTMGADQTGLEDLVVYTANYARTYCSEHGLVLEVSAEGPWPAMRLTSEQRRNIFLVVKEALHNVVKHARARKVELRLAWMDGLHVLVKDDGLGLPKGTEDAVGNGLRNMRKRIALLGGSFAMSGEAGTLIAFEVPVGPSP